MHAIKGKVSFLDVVAGAGVGAFTGAIWFGLAISIGAAMGTGRIEDAGWVIAIVPMSLIFAALIAWPIGIVIGVLVILIVKPSRIAAAAIGYATASLLLLILAGFTWPEFGAGEVLVTVAMLSSGIVGGLMAHRTIFNPPKFDRQRYP